ncbi:MAG: putative carboxylesterase [Rhodospirillales bacterium]|jgi:pimeloyl-ACP methyl ester carboxylesterase|nr:putative carboxylesterase [Rhodospirillales bacterium]
MRMTLEKMALDGPFAGIELGYADWGAPAAGRVAVCVHGLTRNARDFDPLAEALAGRGYRVIAVDVVGRGRSSWLPDPKGYVVPQYIAHLSRFLALMGLRGVDWIGTSMGGIIGMGLAAGDETPIGRLVLNDIGPFVPREALVNIQTYLGLDLGFSSLEEVEQHLRMVHSGFGRLEDHQWRHLAEHGSRRDERGWRLHYDPAIRIPYADLTGEDIDLWPIWDRIACPTLVLRGAESTLLTEATAQEMQHRGPKATLVTIPEAGHAPALMAAEQIQTILRWLGP